MKTFKEIQDNYRAIDFFLSMSCNKNCHYCTSYTLEMRNLTVDMTFLKTCLEYLKDYKVRINLLGGEPGLIKNLREVIYQIEKKKEVELIAIGIGHDVSRYYSKAVTIMDVDQLGEVLLEELSEIFNIN